MDDDDDGDDWSPRLLALAPPSKSPPSSSPRVSGAELKAVGGAVSNKGAAQLSGWWKSTAATLEGHVKEIRENTKLAAQELADGVQKGITKATVNYLEERFEATFIERALGLELDLSKGALVRGLKPGGQGERLQICAQDRLIAIAGEPLPVWEEGNNKQFVVEDFIEEVQQRMKRMPRPVTLTFARMVEFKDMPPQDSGKVAEDQDLIMGAVKKGLTKVVGTGGHHGGGREGPTGAELLAEVVVAREVAQRCEAEAAEARDEAKQQADDAIAAVEEAAALRADLADLQLSRAWSAQEAQRCLAEAEAARAEAAESRAALDASAGERERLRASAAAAEEVAAGERQAAAAHRAEAERLRLRLGGAEAAAEELQRARGALEQGLQEALQQLREVEALRADEAQQAFSRLDAANARAAGAQSLRAVSLEDVKHAEMREAAANLEAQALAAELSSMRSDTHRLAAADKLVPELRREVERLRKDMVMLEATGGATHGAESIAAESSVHELAQELGHLRSELLQERQARAAGVCREASDAFTDGNSGVQPLPFLGPQTAAASTEETSSVCIDAQKHDGVEEQPLVAEAVKARLSEVEQQNAALRRQLDARPIVFQFAPSLDDDVEDEIGQGEEEEEDAGESASSAIISGRTPSGSHAEVVSHDSFLSVVYGAATWCRHRLRRGFLLLRKQRQAQSLERTLRTFTRSMLQSPVLLWLWYVHIIVLWFLEAWRQAVSQTLATDPTERINQRMVETSSPVSAPASNG